METDAIQSIFNLLVSLAVLGFILYRRQSFRDIMPTWTILAPISLMFLMELEGSLALIIGYDNLLIHRVFYLLLVISLLLLAIQLPTPNPPPGEKR